MLCLTTTCLRNVLQDILVAAHEVDEALRTDSELVIDALIKVEASIDHLIGFVTKYAHHAVKHRS